MLNSPIVAKSFNQLLSFNSLKIPLLNSTFDYLDPRIRYSIKSTKNKKFHNNLEGYLQKIISSQPLKLTIVLGEKKLIKPLEDNLTPGICSLKLKSLVIEVEDNFDDEDIVKLITSSIVSFKELYSVSLSLSSMVFLDKFSSFLENLTKLPNLTRLLIYLNNNSNEASTLNPLTDNLIKLSGLEKLTLSFERLNELETSLICSCLLKLKNLKTLDLILGNIEGEQISTILPILTIEMANCSLNLEIKLNKLKRETMMLLMNSVQYLRNLVKLKLDISTDKGKKYLN